MSGFSVFDDVAFYYLSQAVLTVFIVPWTLVKLVSYCWGQVQQSRASKSDYFSASNHEYELQGTKLVNKKDWKREWLRPKNVFFILLWVVFIYQCAQAGEYAARDMSKTWDPVDILGVSADADEETIRQSYRNLSLVWHPDKHPPERREYAQQKFIEIQKAYKSLTDPKAKANMRKYGNIDGHQGVNMTIGLPSFLTDEKNSLKTLLVYFIVMIVLPPVCVFMWWRKAAGVHESGISRETIANYWHLVGEQMGPKFLVGVMCSAAEFKELGRDHSSEKEADRKKLRLEVQEFMVKTLASKLEFCDRAHVLTLAYLLRVPIPESLQPDLTLILQDAHKLLGALFSICVQRRYVKAAMGCIELMQMMTQAMAPGFSPLLQVPFLTSREIRLAARHKLDTLEKFRAAEDDKKMKVYPGHSEADWKRIKEVSDRLPDIAMECHTLVEGESGIFEGDLVTIRVTLERITPGITRKQTQSKKVAVVEGDGETETNVTDDKDDVDDSSVVSELVPSEEDDVLEKDAKEIDERERKYLETLPVAKQAPSKFGKDNQEVMVHSAFYPFPKPEKWVLLLFQKTKNKTLHLLAAQKVPDFREKEVVELRMKVGEKGVWPYELHAKCDSYVGCDVSLNFRITVNKFSKQQEDRRDARIAKSKECGLDDDEDAAEQEYKGKWYYAGFASFWELAMNLTVLLVLFLFVVNFLQQRGYWRAYVEPVLDRVYVVIAPAWNKIAPVLRPVVVPIYNFIESALASLGNWMNVDPEELVRLKQQEL